MNKKVTGIIVVVILILLMAFVYNIMASGTHYSSKDSSGNEISFNYLNGWAFQERTAGVLIQGEKNSTDNSTNRSVVTITRISVNKTSLDQVKNNDIYFKTGKVLNETNRTVDGVQASVIDIEEMAGPERGKLGEVKLVLFSKDNYIYTISFVTGGSLEGLKNDIDHILNSFHTGS
nr:PsbP-related protein [uncultured Methanobacterium sp.]